MTRSASALTLVVTLALCPGLAAAQSTGAPAPMAQHDAHAMHMAHGAGGGAGGGGQMPEGITEPGQAAFAAIGQIVARLMADPATDWSRVDVAALRQHLIDMDNVTLRAQVAARDIDGGARFDATSADPAVTASIRTMLRAHAATMDGVNGWSMSSFDIPQGEALVVSGADPAPIRALGLIGLLTVGMHHQSHHWAMASGQNPHAHE